MTDKDDARLAVVLTGLAAAALVLVVADDLWRLHWLPAPGGIVYAAVAALMVLAGVGPWLARRRRRGHTVAVRCEDGVVRMGSVPIAAEDVRALSVARAARGRSVAIARRDEVVFVEVERAADAARIEEALGACSQPIGALGVRRRSRRLAVPQLVLSLVAIIFATAYVLVTALGYASPWAFPDPKALFGVGGVIAAELSALLLFARALLPRHALGLSRTGAWEAHAALHSEQERAPAADEGPAPLERLRRGDEAVGMWLARIDAMPTEPHAYRGDALTKDVLWAALGDPAAPVDARMGAARVLRRRHGEDERALVRVVDDPDVRVRVSAAIEEQEEAELHIATLGPLFRAR